MDLGPILLLRSGGETVVSLKQEEDSVFSLPDENYFFKLLTNSDSATSNIKQILCQQKIDPPIVSPQKNIRSFCFVTTSQLKSEAAVLLFSLRQYHDQEVFVVADQESIEYLKAFDFSNVNYKLIKVEEEIVSELRKKYDHINTFHKVDCIYAKMDAMKWALESHCNTFFLDSDIIVLNSLQENFCLDLCFSRHNHEEIRLDNRVGIYNAGYVFCSNKDFPDWWRENYITRSLFYEQECMNRAVQRFSLQVFPENHNIGFWRLNYPTKGIKSFHNHLSTCFDENQPVQIKEKNLKLRKFIYEYLYQNNFQELLDFIKGVI